MDVRSEAPPAQWQEESWSGWYIHLCHHMRDGFVHCLRKHAVLTIITLILLPIVIFWQRDHIQPIAVLLRRYAGDIVIVVALVTAGWFFFRFFGKKSTRWSALGAVLGGAFASLIVFAWQGIHNYASLYVRYNNLKLTELSQLPTTDHERVLPLDGVYTLVAHRMNRTTRAPTQPDFVRDGSEFAWTMAIEPTSFLGVYWHGVVDGVLKLRAEDPSPDLSRYPPEKVLFGAGEGLGLGANVTTCVRRAFGPWRFLNYDVGNVYNIKNDAGKYVIAVSLIRWRGILFPRPEDGGVQIIEQGHQNMVYRAFMGCGYWIPPEHVRKHTFLQAQNNVPYEVTRFMAQSFWFQKGLWAAMPWNKEGVVEIADLPESANKQPFTLFFRMPGEEQKGKLYHYFALKPADLNKKGLAVSFFYPADGQGKAYVYRHADRDESPLGVSQVVTQLVASRRQYDWEKNTAAEQNPYIRDIADSEGNVKRRAFWRSTVVTLAVKREEGKPLVYEPGAVPEIALTDWDTGQPVWVNPYEQDRWPETVRAELGKKWAGKFKSAP